MIGPKASPVRPDHPNARWWQPRFGIGTLLLITFLCCIMAAVYGAWKRYGIQPGSPANAFFVLLVVGAPFFAMMLMNVYRWLKRLASWLQR
jgi:hypothetical protein